MKKTYWLILNGKGQPLTNSISQIELFWGKEVAVIAYKNLVKSGRKFKLKRKLVKATILWEKK